MARSTTRSALTREASAMIGGDAASERAVITMTSGGRIDNRATWVFLWEGITVPIGFQEAPPPP